MSSIDDYITVSAFASLIGVSVQAIHKAIAKNTIKDVTRIGPLLVIHKSEVRKFKEYRS